MNRVIVVGAGMGGMCAAARLAKMGHSVHVIEATSTFGGKCRREWVGDVAFDLGPTLLTIPAVYRDLFQRTGKHLGQVLHIKPVDPSFDYRFADGSSVLFTNLSRKKTLDSIAESFGEKAAREWDSALKQAEAMWDVSREPFIEHELHPRSFLRPHFLKDLFTIKPWSSLRSIDISDTRLRMILDRYATYSGSDPRRAPAVLSTIAFIEEAFGAWHVEGGMGALAEAIYQRCLDLGVTFTFNRKVSSITLSGKRARGVLLDDATAIEAEKIIINGDARTFYDSAISTKHARRERKKLRKAERSFSGFSLLLTMRRHDHGLAHHTVLFPRDYDAEFVSIFAEKKPVTHPAIYICAPDDPAMRSNNEREGWSVLVNAPCHGDFDWSDEAFSMRYAESIIDQMEERGVAVRAHLVSYQIRTPLDLENETLSPGGSIYGTSSNGPRAAFMRAKNRSPIKELYFVGGSAHPGGGLPLVGLSAEMVAEAIGGRNGRPAGH